jgi:hypothetical protein
MGIKHIVLAGDSIFDNDGYVIGEAGVIEQMRTSLPSAWSATKVAVDGDCIRHVSDQIRNLPENATDLVVSVGGNDARQYTNLFESIQSGADLADLLAKPLADFRTAYRAMLDVIKTTNLRLHVCTIYTEVPFTDPIWRLYAPLAIGQFNNVIIEEANSGAMPIFRLDKVCVQESDFAENSPIEPSSQGGQKIVDYILSKL